MTATAPDAWGIQQDWIDAYDQPHRVPDPTVAALREAIGAPPADLEQRAPVVTRPGRRLGLVDHGGSLEVECEDGSRRTLGDLVPEDFPLGYHRLLTADGSSRRLIVSPGRCWLPEDRLWGWTVQLYAARSRSSWGIGDLGDLRTLREWTAAAGGGFLLVNPLHAVAPTLPQEASPYLPATRRFRNPVYLRVEDVPGAVVSGDLARAREVNGLDPIDRDAVWALKRDVLWRTFCDTDAGRDPAFSAWREQQGRALEEFATWCTLAEQHGPDWRDWPAGLRRPDGPEVAAYAEDRADRVSFHAWLQWQLDVQLRRAAGDLMVLQDLPIGVSGGGADAWAWPDEVAGGITVGAPPDLLNSTGQDWGSPPLVPWRLRAADYEPFIQSLRGTIAGAGGLRIDHVMGLFRLWWIPEGHAATDGAYVRYPSEDLLDIVALESHRAQAVVVGEDLGTVEPGVREALAERGILSYRLLWFEEDDPADWPASALAAVTTHDLPTVAGLWTGSDAEDQLATTTMTEDDVRAGRADLLARLQRDGELSATPGPGPVAGPVAGVDEAVTAAYRQLGRAPSLLLSVALEDAVREERRPNVPGTVARDNWRIPLRVPVEDLPQLPEAVALARLVDGAVRRDGVSPPA
ncbi:4-alpha-glucanotransferase [Nocardioides panaciterrulae]|uniref:4-alpha-glucanotransferase n=1 Tax=Nocardioides panaciterrulae TaxID=661492 RepID=A0A7Y9E5C5_9ACTN|nr:4-alpha-glucanotransferase [Nocardioides panaciterrulae]NYD41384.1 4-alpha-glucanotransferase [Nocardioides panaciterrulae]